MKMSLSVCECTVYYIGKLPLLLHLHNNTFKCWILSLAMLAILLFIHILFIFVIVHVIHSINNEIIKNLKLSD